MVKSILMPTADERARIGTVLQWLKKAGEKFEKGDPLFVAETAKAVMEVEAPESGTLIRILAKEGTAVIAGGPVALYAAKGEEIAPDFLKPPPVASVTIRLLDERLVTVRNATVTIDGDDLTLTEKGDFTAAAVSPGTHTIHVKAPGFLEKSLTVSIREGENVTQEFRLISLTKKF